jgi:hypothetical protein
MSKGWRIIGTLVLVLALLGAICIGVGFMTGGDVVEVYSSLNTRFNLTGYWEAYSGYAADRAIEIRDAVMGLF